MLGKISIKYLVILSGLFFIAVNILIFYQRIMVNGLKSDFASEYGKLTRENYLLSEKIIRYMKMNQMNTKIRSTSDSEYFFVWRYYNDFCKSCIEQEIILLKDHISSIGAERIKILASTDNPRDLKSFLNSHDLGQVEIIILPDYETNIFSDEQLHRPFYFVADSTGNATMIFEPDIELPDLSEKYFEMVINRYFNSR
jgi:hypothetical protein